MDKVNSLHSHEVYRLVAETAETTTNIVKGDNFSM